MSVYSISYDLRTPGKSYSELYKAIKSIGDYQHPLESTWFVSTSFLGSHSIYKELSETIDKNDSLFVTKVTADYSGWMPKEFWEWLRKNV